MNEKMLKQAQELGIIGEGFTQELERMVKEREKQKVIENHKAAITPVNRKGKVLYVTTVPDSSKADGRRQISAVSREGLENKIYEEYLKSEKSVKAYYYEYLKETVENNRIKKNTAERKDYSFKQLFEPIADIPLSQLKEEDVTSFIESMCAKGVSKSAYKNARSYLKNFLLWAKRHKYTDINVHDAIGMAQVSPAKQCKTKKKKEKDEVFLDSELEILVDYLIEHKDNRRALAVLLLFACGDRMGEIVALRSCDISDNAIEINYTEHRYKKEQQEALKEGKKHRTNGSYDYVLEENAKTEAGEREIVIPTEAHWVLRELKKNTADNEYVVRNEDGERINANALRAYYRKTLKRLGLQYKKPHAIRKTYASILLDNCADKKFVQKQLGHVSVLTTEQYYHRDRRTIEQKQEILDNMVEFRLLGQTKAKQG